MQDKKKIKHLVVDTSAFIKNVQLQEVGENIVTCQEVIDEIKNDKQLSRLVVLPYDLKIRQPFQENFQYVTEFAKKTGDYAALSLTDLKVIALTYEMEKQENGTDHLKKEPIKSTTVYAKSKPKTDEMESKFAPPGFYLANETDEQKKVRFERIEKLKKESAVNSSTATEPETVEENLDELTEDELAAKIAGLTCQESDQPEEEVLKKIEEPICGDEKSITTEGTTEDIDEDNDDDNVESEEEEEDDDDSGGWITPANIQKIRQNLDPQSYDSIVPEVACMTSDFAMQNVLKQIGLHVSALDGRVIKHTRTFILRCYSCFRTTPDVTKIFCPRCGNKTLKRVSVSIDKDGKQVIHINTRKPLTAKFKNQPLPAPKGGKHACNPILCEDQPIPQQRLSKKAMTKTNPLDEDYIAGYSPFVLRDTDSRSAMLRNTNNIKQWMKNYEYDNHRRGYKKK